MNPFKNLSQEALLIALIEYYEKCRRIVESGGDEDEFITAKFTLQGILDELNLRRGQTKPMFELEERNNLGFNRINTKAE